MIDLSVGTVADTFRTSMRERYFNRSHFDYTTQCHKPSWTNGNMNWQANRQIGRISCDIELKHTWTVGQVRATWADKRIAAVVQSALTYFDSQRYRLSAWVVMPNHVHLSAAPCIGHSVSNIMHSLKSYTAQEANKMLNRRGSFWFEDYFDRYIRNAKHFENAVNYIESNPERAGLCELLAIGTSAVRVL